MILKNKNTGEEQHCEFWYSPDYILVKPFGFETPVMYKTLKDLNEVWEDANEAEE